MNFANGTSLLTEQGGPYSDGWSMIGTYNPDGSYEGFWFDTAFSGGVTQPDVCWSYPTGGQSCFWPPPVMCPYVAGGAALAVKWGTVAATKNKGAGDVIGLIIGVAVNQFCNSPSNVPPQTDPYPNPPTGDSIARKYR